MNRIVQIAGVVFACAAQSAFAQAAPAAGASKPVVVESYYRVRWGSADEFKRLYHRNETALLREMQKQGLVTALSLEEPMTHIAGGPRWDFRARITYRDGIAAVETGGTYDKAFEAARARLRPDKAAFDAEQAKRMSLLEDHWDVVVTPVTE